MVGNATLRIVVSADFGRAVTRRDEGLATRCDIVYILLMLVVIDKGAQSCQGTLLVLGLIAGLGTLDENFLLLARVGIGPHVAQTHTTVHLVHVLATGTAAAEGIPLDFALVDVHVKRLCLGQHSHAGCRGVYAALGFGDRHTLHAVHARFILQGAIDVVARDAEYHLLETAHGSFAARGHLHIPALGLAVAGVHACQLAGKQGGLVASRASSNLKHHVLAIFRVLGNKQEFDFLFQFGHLGLVGVDFLTRHGTQVLVGLGVEDGLGLLDVLKQFAVTVGGSQQGLQALVFLRQFDVAPLVGYDVGIGNQRADFLKSGIQAVKAL